MKTFAIWICLALSAVSLSACVVAPYPGYYGHGGYWHGGYHRGWR